MTISTLVVGFGYAAKTFHVPFLTHLADFEINAVVSSDPAKVHDQLPESAVFASLEQALAASRFDLVVITTPNHLHAPQTKAALEAGCHVLVEKPFTLDSEEGESLVALAKQGGMPDFVDQRTTGARPPLAGCPRRAWAPSEASGAHALSKRWQAGACQARRAACCAPAGRACVAIDASCPSASACWRALC